MRILFLSYRLAHAGAISGQRIVYQRMKHLTELGHEVGLASLVKPKDEPHIESLRKMLFELEVVHLKNISPLQLRWKRGLGLIPPPYNAQYSPELSRVAGRMVEQSHYDVVVAEFSSMGQHILYNPYMPAVRKIISCHQCDTVGLRNFLDEQTYFTAKNWIHRLWYHRLKHYEFKMYRNVDRVLVLTPEERNELMAFSLNIPITIIRGGVDLEYFAPTEKRPERHHSNLIYTGHFMDELNRDAVIWFIKDVWPKIKERHPLLKFYVLGPYPSATMRSLAKQDDDIILTGLIEDIRDHLRNADIFVCPIRIGSGLRGKVLEAMACALPVVSTSLGMEGIPAQTGVNCVIADSADIMVSSIDLLLKNKSLHKRIANNARELVEQHFSWSNSTMRLEKTICEVLGKD